MEEIFLPPRAQAFVRNSAVIFERRPQFSGRRVPCQKLAMRFSSPLIGQSGDLSSCLSGVAIAGSKYVEISPSFRAFRVLRLGKRANCTQGHGRWTFHGNLCLSTADHRKRFSNDGPEQRSFRGCRDRRHPRTGLTIRGECGRKCDRQTYQHEQFLNGTFAEGKKQGIGKRLRP